MNHWIRLTKWRVHDSSSISSKLYKVLTSLELLNQNTTVSSNKHHASTWLDFFSAKCANSTLCIYFHLALIFLASRPVSFNIDVPISRSQNVPCDNSPNVTWVWCVVYTLLLVKPLRSFRFCLQLQQPQQPSTEDTLLLFTHIFQLELEFQAFRFPTSSTTSSNNSLAP